MRSNTEYSQVWIKSLQERLKRFVSEDLTQAIVSSIINSEENFGRLRVLKNNRLETPKNARETFRSRLIVIPPEAEPEFALLCDENGISTRDANRYSPVVYLPCIKSVAFCRCPYHANKFQIEEKEWPANLDLSRYRIRFSAWKIIGTTDVSRRWDQIQSDLVNRVSKRMGPENVFRRVYPVQRRWDEIAYYVHQEAVKNDVKTIKAGRSGIAQWKVKKHRYRYGAVGLIVSTANLQGVDLRKADLRRTVFTGATLNRSRFDGADLSDSYLNRISAQCASFIGTNLEMCDLSNANLNHSWMISSNLTSSYLVGISLRGSQLGKANFFDAEFTSANLVEIHAQDACFQFAELENVTFINSDLRGADFRGANLRNARFENCKLQKADLRYANLSSTTFVGCDLTRSDISYANVYGTTLGAARTLDLRRKRVYWDLEERQPPGWWGDAIEIQHRAFVCYSSAQSPSVRLLAKRVNNEHGIYVWIDERIEPSDEFWKEIETEIKGSTVLLLFWSKEASESKNVGRECRIAFENGIPILPIKMDQTRLPLDIEDTIQYLNINTPNFYDRLLSGIRRAGRRRSG